MERMIQFYNIDNISRTKAYEKFSQTFPQIRYARLAALMSRNVGWAMTDLLTQQKQLLYSQEVTERLVSLYEQVERLSFHDTYMQLRFYARAKRKGEPLFDQLTSYGVSAFMKQEWLRFWEKRDENRLLYALIINTQFMIQHCLISQLPRALARSWAKDVKTNGIMLPTSTGTLYQVRMTRVLNVVKRVEYVKKVATLLYHPEIEWGGCQFLMSVEPTGLRREYDPHQQQDGVWPLRVSFPRLNMCAFIEKGRSDWYLFCDPAQVDQLFQPVVVKPEAYRARIQKSVARGQR